MDLKAPFPYFGGKSTVSDLVWQRFGDTYNYVEPFAGSLAVLLKRPHEARVETVNDADCYLSNFWRALQHDPEAVAFYADWPVNEADLHARHLWLVNQADFRERMMTDPDYYDAKIAGWWVWGISAWIGSGWCEVKDRPAAQVRHLSGGQGVHSQAVNGRSRPQLRPHQGVQGVARQIPHIGDSGRGDSATTVSDGLTTYLAALADRLRRVRVCCGDWSRITGASVTYKIGMTAVFLDPPYDPKEREAVYAVEDDGKGKPISQAVREWCIEEVHDKPIKYKGRRDLHPKMRIALCGYEGEGHEELEALGWECVAWKANGGYSNQNSDCNDNRSRERIWFSPNCLKPVMEYQPSLFEEVA